MNWVGFVASKFIRVLPLLISVVEGLTVVTSLNDCVGAVGLLRGIQALVRERPQKVVHLGKGV